MKTLLIVSGGDAPGINAALHRFTSLAEAHHHQVVGAVGGFAGAVAGHLVDLRSEMLAPFARLGGSYLVSSREPVMNQPLNRVKLIETISRHQIDNMLLFGGDGTLRHIPPILADMGLACVSVPTTIDNNVPGTTETIGFDTACNAAHQVIDGIIATARALPGRVFSVETLGGNSGILALAIAYAAGADAVLVPEYDYNEDWLLERLRYAVHSNKMALLIVCEGIADSRTLVERMQTRQGLHIRDTRLGHGQRGGPPTHRDRWLAFRMVDCAFQALNNGISIGTVVMNAEGHVTLLDHAQEGLPARLPDIDLYRQINGLNVEVFS